jgi:SM-20-related protein
VSGSTVYPGFQIMHGLDLAAFRATPLIRQPFDYLIVPGFIKPEARAAIHADYPRIDSPGSFPVAGLSYGPAFRALLEALEGPEMRAAFAEKFGIDLTGRPTMVTVRGQSGTKDGHIHTDALTKIITVLIYMNPQWEDAGGRLRLLRSAHDLDDVIVEVPPVEGTLLAFRRSDNSFHGHKPFVGPRRVIQLNWVTDHATVRREVLRHHVSAWMKKAFALVRSPFGRRATEKVA